MEDMEVGGLAWDGKADGEEEEEIDTGESTNKISSRKSLVDP